MDYTKRAWTFGLTPPKQFSSDAGALYSNGYGRCWNPGGVKSLSKSYGMRTAMKLKLIQSHQGHLRPVYQGAAPLLSSDGTTLLTDKFQILKHWAEHFRSVLYCSSAISDAAINRLLRVDTNYDLDLPPSLPETIRAVQQMSSGKAPGSGAIPAEV
ncbi:unnamed protein product [Schistocephalus solidus]|uniref:Uncharacterized protein n=1 Tax=Schistocephalus solidus TaxID=70667 RepID=A0A183T3K4_SCHSO|nr:unnamed protein product [Schistocephalus solidus]